MESHNRKGEALRERCEGAYSRRYLGLESATEDGRQAETGVAQQNRAGPLSARVGRGEVAQLPHCRNLPGSRGHLAMSLLVRSSGMTVT